MLTVETQNYTLNHRSKAGGTQTPVEHKLGMNMEKEEDRRRRLYMLLHASDRNWLLYGMVFGFILDWFAQSQDYKIISVVMAVSFVAFHWIDVLSPPNASRRDRRLERLGLVPAPKIGKSRPVEKSGRRK